MARLFLQHVNANPKHIALLAWLLLTLAGAGFIATRLNISSDLTAFLPKTQSPIERILVSQLRDGVASRLVLIAIEGSDAASLAHASKVMAQTLHGSPQFTYVNNGDVRLSVSERKYVFTHRYLLSSALTSPDYFSVDNLRAKLQESLRDLASPAGNFIKPLLPYDPTGETLSIAQAWIPKKGPVMRDGVWFSEDGRRTLLLAETRAPAFEIESQRTAQAIIKNTFAQLRLKDARLVLSGPSVFAVQAKDAIHGDAVKLSIIASLAVALILLLSYRSWRLLLLGTLPVISGIMAGIIAVALGFGTVHAITLGFGVTLIGEAIDYPTYLFTQRSEKENLAETLYRIWPTLRLAILTTVFGNLALLASSFTGLAQLGLFSIVGIATAGLVTRWVLPHLAPARFTFPPSRFIAPSLVRAAAFATRLRYFLFALIAASAIFLIWQREHLWDNDLANLSPISAEGKQLDARLRAEMGAADLRYLIVVTAPTQEATLQKSEALLPVLTRWSEQNLISGFDMAALYFPSAATQASRQNAIPDPRILRNSMQAALQSLPFQPNLFEPFLHEIAEAKARPPLHLSDLAGSGLYFKVRSLLTEQDGQWVALVPLQGVQNAARLEQEISTPGADSVIFLDLKSKSNQMVNSYRAENLKLSGMGLLLILVLLSLGLKSVPMALRVITPPVFAVIVTIASLALLGEKISLFHLVSLLLVIGIGLNYALFFNLPREKDNLSTEFSIVVCNLTTLITFGILYFSHTPVLHGIGMTVAIGAFLSLIFSAILARRRV